MTKIKLKTGEILNCETVEVMGGVLYITTQEKTVEELAALFADKEKTSNLILLTESGKESGYKTGFTSFSGINYTGDGLKTIELYQPADVTEARLSAAEGTAVAANNTAESTAVKVDDVQAAMQVSLEEVVTELTLALSGQATSAEEGII